MIDTIEFVVSDGIRKKQYTVKVEVPGFKGIKVNLTVEVAKQILNQFVEAVTYLETFKGA